MSLLMPQQQQCGRQHPALFSCEFAGPTCAEATTTMGMPLPSALMLMFLGTNAVVVLPTLLVLLSWPPLPLLWSWLVLLLLLSLLVLLPPPSPLSPPLPFLLLPFA